MNKPSERIVVFVTTAQKRAIASTAENMGISVSELMRRAVLSFGATSEQVKAASIVDRLRAPRAPDALDAALQRVARGTRYARAALPPALQTRDGSETAGPADTTPANPSDSAQSTASTGIGAGKSTQARSTPAAEPAPLLPAGVAAALAADFDEEAAATAEAVARVAAAKAASVEGTPAQQPDADALLRSVLKRPRLDSSRDNDDPLNDPSTNGGRFA